MHVLARRQRPHCVVSKLHLLILFLPATELCAVRTAVQRTAKKVYGVLRRQIIGRVGGRKNKTRWIRQLGNNWWVTQCIYKVHSMPQQDLKPDFIGQSKCCVWGLTKIGFRILSCWDMRDWVRIGVFFFRRTKDEKPICLYQLSPNRMDANSQEMQFFFSLFPKKK